jgi:hypothetical protein
MISHWRIYSQNYIHKYYVPLFIYVYALFNGNCNKVKRFISIFSIISHFDLMVNFTDF